MREINRPTARPAVSLNALDRVLGWFAPASALERGQARARLDAAAETGGYRGGRRDRRMLRTWRPLGGSADSDTLPDLPDLRARSRDLERNDPIAGGAIATTVTHVVGDELQLQAAIDADVLGLTPDQASAWQRRAEQEWWLFCRTCDVTRVQTFGGLQRLALRSVLQSGDVLAIRRFRRDPGDVYGTKLQLVEADRLSNPDRAADTTTIAGGVETSSDGVPIAYHVSDRHPGEIKGAALAWSRVPARSPDGLPVVLHLFERLRPEMTRGVPYLAPVIEHLKKLSRYSDAEVTAAVVSALYTVFLETDDDEGAGAIAGERDGSPGLAENEVKLGEGAVVALAPGEKANAVSPGRPNAQFDPFFIAVVRQIGVALELPFEFLMKHFTASYSASKAAIELAWMVFRSRRAWLAECFCQVVYEWFLDEAIALGRLTAPGYFADPLIRQAWCGAEWHGPAKIVLDAVKEANADKTDIETGVKTRKQVCLERTGGQWEDKHRELVREHEMRAADGLGAPEPTTPSGATTEADPAADPSSDPDQQDDQEQRRSA